MAVTNILYFPQPASGGGIERNFALWYGRGRARHRVMLASKTQPSFCDTDDFVSSRFSALVNLIRRRKNSGDVRLFVFRGMMKPLFLKWFSRALGASVKIFYRASNDPLHWWHERSPKRALAELSKFVFLRFYDGIVFNSEELKNRSRAYGSRGFLLRNAVPANAKIHFHSSEKKKFLYVGRAARQKNLTSLMEAFALLGPDYQLDLMGAPADTLSCPENVTVLPWQEDVPYARYDYFIMPSLYEGAPNALLEAVNEGLICVLTPFHSGGSEILTQFDAPHAVADGFTGSEIAQAVKKVAAKQVDIRRATPKAFEFASFDDGLAELMG